MAVERSLVEGVTEYEDVVLDVDMDAAGDISAQTFEATFRGQGGTLVTKTGGAGIVITAAGSATTKGAIAVTLASADTHALGPGDCTFEVWRTNPGAEARLAFGDMTIAAQQTF